MKFSAVKTATWLMGLAMLLGTGLCAAQQALPPPGPLPEPPSQPAGITPEIADELEKAIDAANENVTNAMNTAANATREAEEVVEGAATALENALVPPGGLECEEEELEGGKLSTECEEEEEAKGE